MGWLFLHDSADFQRFPFPLQRSSCYGQPRSCRRTSESCSFQWHILQHWAVMRILAYSHSSSSAVTRQHPGCSAFFQLSLHFSAGKGDFRWDLERNKWGSEETCQCTCSFTASSQGTLFVEGSQQQRAARMHCYCLCAHVQRHPALSPPPNVAVQKGRAARGGCAMGSSPTSQHSRLRDADDAVQPLGMWDVRVKLCPRKAS